MKSSIRKPQLNSVLAFLMTACLFAVAGLFFDFYYDLNDDVLIKDIVSGAYSGSPDGHSIQMLWPLSYGISLLYRIMPAMPWQGIFLCGCHGICFYLIAKRSLSFVKKTITKVLILLTEAVLVLTLFMWELVMVQYTITAALLAACACFLVFTSPKKEDWKVFLKEQAISIALVLLAFNVRSEMLLLMSPYIAFTGIWKWAEEEKIFEKNTVKKYLGMVGSILLGMGICLVADAVAYAGADWKEFRDFFDARTRVYDYTWYPQYEEAESFYREIGATEAKVELIDNYNFGLDESIDADLLWSIADYAEKTGTKEPITVRLKEALADYKWRIFHEQDAPYNFFVLVAYGMVAALALVYRDRFAIWKIPLLWIFRTIPWMYVILANRVPTRISHPLYYIELIVLCAWMFSYYKIVDMDELSGDLNHKQMKCKVITGVSDKKEGTTRINCNRKRCCAFCAALLGIFALACLPNAWQSVEAEMIRREEMNAGMVEFDAYARSNPKNYYYLDVYSTVDFSEKMFENVNNLQKNYDILGGWASGSPLQKQATIPYQQDTFSRAELLLQDNFYFVCEQGMDTEFLEDFYRGMGMVVSPIEEKKIGAEEKALIIYKIEILGNTIN